MRAIGQITITNICDVAASDTPPENPYVGQLWVDTSVSPPETKIWNGAEWVVQNDVDTIRVTISVLTTRCAELQSTIDGLNSYVGTMTQTLETVTDALGNEQQTVLEMQAQMSLLQQTIDGLTIQVQNQYAGGLNFIQNSAGLNGVSDDWVKTDTVIVDSSTDTQNNTTSDSCFVLGSSATLKQRPLRVLSPGSPTPFRSVRRRRRQATPAISVSSTTATSTPIFSIRPRPSNGRISASSSTTSRTARSFSISTTDMRICMRPTS